MKHHTNDFCLAVWVQFLLKNIPYWKSSQLCCYFQFYAHQVLTPLRVISCKLVNYLSQTRSLCVELKSILKYLNKPSFYRVSISFTKRFMIGSGVSWIPRSEILSLNAEVRAVRALSSLDAFLHADNASPFDVPDSCAIREHSKGFIIPFLNVFKWKSRDALNISQFIATRGVYIPIRTSFFVALAADQTSPTFVPSILKYFINHFLSFKQSRHLQLLQFITHLAHKVLLLILPDLIITVLSLMA